MSDDSEDPMEALVALVAVATLPAAALASMFLGGTAAAVVAIVGWLFLVPVLAILSEYVDLRPVVDRALGRISGDETEESAADTGDDALDRLRERYAAGEIDEAEFERRLERLLATEDVEVRGDVDLDRPRETGEAGDPPGAGNRPNAGERADAAGDSSVREREPE